MANFVYNIAKGRVAEYFHRVKNNDPANSAIIVVAINTSATDATLKDLDTLAAIEANGDTAEATNSNYARKVLTDAELDAITIDDTGDLVQVTIPDQTWTAVATSPGAWTDLVLCYDSDTTGGADSAIIPLTQHDFAVTTDGSDITADVGTNGVFQAS
jgi:hypothetical protein